EVSKKPVRPGSEYRSRKNQSRRASRCFPLGCSEENGVSARRISSRDQFSCPTSTSATSPLRRSDQNVSGCCAIHWRYVSFTTLSLTYHASRLCVLWGRAGK